MIDTLELSRQKATTSHILERLNLQQRQYVVVTLHRPSNVDQPHALEGVLAALGEIQKQFKVVFPVHPRTLKRLESAATFNQWIVLPNVQIMEPLGYFDFLRLMSESRLVITDSGGIQEETTILGIPCLTVRENTERPVTISEGTNMLVGADAGRILAGYKASLNKETRPVRPKFWDGKASERIVRILLESI
jgi:UDP-N-acetylglucosamine 2-epimerase (non-hydrolysing)